MSKGAYVGINGTAHKIKDIYVGVNNIAHKVVKGYVGVNGVAQQFWPAVSVINSWDMWTSVDKVLAQFGWEMTVTKPNKKIAYYGYIMVRKNSFSPLLMSPDRDACNFIIASKIWGQKSYGAIGSITDDNGVEWYFAGMLGGIALAGTPIQEQLVSNKNYSYSLDGYTEAAQDFLDRIYAVPFHENYQVGQTYERIPACGDVYNTIRKIVGQQLAFNVDKYGQTGIYEKGYKTYSDNIDDIISDIMADIHQYGNDNGVIVVCVDDDFWDGSPSITVYHGHYQANDWSNKINYLENVRILENTNPTLKTIEYLWDFGGGDGPEWTDYYFDWGFFERAFFVYVNDDGTYETTSEEAGWSGQFSTTAFLGMYDGHAFIANLGVDL